MTLLLATIAGLLAVVVLLMQTREAVRITIALVALTLATLALGFALSALFDEPERMRSWSHANGRLTPIQNDSPQPFQGCQRGQTDRTDDHPCRGGKTAASATQLNPVEHQAKPLEDARSNRAVATWAPSSPTLLDDVAPFIFDDWWERRWV